jgi:hypothetical protein
MSLSGHIAITIVLSFLLLSGTTLGHSPVEPEDGESLETATHVEDPSKSWAIYGRLEGGGDAWYFKMDLDAGDRLYLSLLSTEEDFVPDLVVMGPGWERPSSSSIDVDVPQEYGWIEIEGEATEAEFEPFTPGSYYHVVVFDEEVDVAGTYYVAVHTEGGSGPFSLAVGYLETFTIMEWLSLPVSLIGIYRWEGQGWGTILAPALVVIVAGLALIIWHARREGRAPTLFQWTSALSGIFILSWAAIALTQMTMALGKSGWSNAALVSMGFALGSIIMALYAILPAFRGPDVPDMARRMWMLVVAGLALFLYTGLYVGPVLAIVAALLPNTLASIRFARSTSERPQVAG